MTKLLLFSLLLSFSLYADESTSTDEVVLISNEVPATETEETPKAEEVVQEIPSEAANSMEFVDLLKIYLATNKVKDGTELVWSILDNDYQKTKNDDFQYQKIKEEKLKEAQKEIDESLKQERAINVSLIIGKYDFKNETFPVESVNVSSGMFSLSDTNLLKFDLFYTGAGSKADQYELATIAYLKIENLKKINPVKLKKEIAEKITSTLSMSRSLSCVLEIETPKVKLETTKLGKMISRNFKAKTQYKKIRCYFDENRSLKAFEN